MSRLLGAILLVLCATVVQAATGANSTTTTLTVTGTAAHVVNYHCFSRDL